MSAFDIRQYVDRHDLDIVQSLRGIETATFGHLVSEGFMAPSIQRLGIGTPVCGPALTVSVPPDDGVVLAHAISLARPGDVLVVDRQRDERHACWGAILTAAAQVAGIAGVIIDGFVTDVAAILASELPVWCRGRSPLTTKLIGRGGSIHAEISCGGARVCAGDMILADENGVFVLPSQNARALIEKARVLQDAEPNIIARVQAGEKIDTINGARSLIELNR